MGEQSGWQVAGTAPEMMERYLIPAFATTYAELVALAALHGGERVLDVACGTGGVTRRVAQAVGAAGKVVGIDVNEGMLSMARTEPQRHDGPPIEWRHSDAVALPFPHAAFDVVLCQYGLEFFADRAAGLREMARVLVPGAAWSCGSGVPWSGNPSMWRCVRRWSARRFWRTRLAQRSTNE